jgi:hypothetical protein
MFSSDAQDKVAHFGHWAEDSSHNRLLRDAVAVLREATYRCADEDVRSPELRAALLVLERHMTRPSLCSTLRQNLDIRDSYQRAVAARETFGAIVRNLFPS